MMCGHHGVLALARWVLTHLSPHQRPHRARQAVHTRASARGPAERALPGTAAQSGARRRWPLPPAEANNHLGPSHCTAGRICQPQAAGSTGGGIIGATASTRAAPGRVGAGWVGDRGFGGFFAGTPPGPPPPAHPAPARGAARADSPLPAAPPAAPVPPPGFSCSSLHLTSFPISAPPLAHDGRHHVPEVRQRQRCGARVQARLQGRAQVRPAPRRAGPRRDLRRWCVAVESEPLRRSRWRGAPRPRRRAAERARL
jgi:hypothetical protein